MTRCVDPNILLEAVVIDARIMKWVPCWPECDHRYVLAQIYGQMTRVYLMSTISSPAIWTQAHRVSAAIDDILPLLKLIATSSPAQKFLLTPVFIIGCAAMDDAHRAAILESISIIKIATSSKNADQALEVLVYVWSLLDVKHPESWDWESVASQVGLDFIPA
jgi:hypothetical protein